VPSKWKGLQRGAKGNQQGEQGELARGARGIVPCIQGGSDISGIFYRDIKNDITQLKIIRFY
jgi:hypothetical protein